MHFIAFLEFWFWKVRVRHDVTGVPSNGSLDSKIVLHFQSKFLRSYINMIPHERVEFFLGTLVEAAIRNRLSNIFRHPFWKTSRHFALEFSTQLLRQILASVADLPKPYDFQKHTNTSSKLNFHDRRTAKTKKWQSREFQSCHFVKKIFRRKSFDDRIFKCTV